MLGAGSALLDDVVESALIEAAALTGTTDDPDAERRLVRGIAQRHATAAFAERQRARVLAPRPYRQRTTVSRALPALRQVALAA